MKLLILADINDFHWQHGKGEADVVVYQKYDRIKYSYILYALTKLSRPVPRTFTLAFLAQQSP